jgi:uncharacterized protein YgiM (DUF1202 family)
MRRLTLTGISAALVLVLVAGCGGNSATPSPSDTVATEGPAETEAPIESGSEPVSEPTVAPVVTGTIMYAACGNVAVRKGPASDQGLVVRLAKGTKVKVAETVTGTAYNAGKCGDSGDQWLKISRIAGKSVQKAYGVQYAYAAAGFFGAGQP